jgi:hypothetical protein
MALAGEATRAKIRDAVIAKVGGPGRRCGWTRRRS